MQERSPLLTAAPPDGNGVDQQVIESLARAVRQRIRGALTNGAPENGTEVNGTEVNGETEGNGHEPVNGQENGGPVGNGHDAPTAESGTEGPERDSSSST